MMLSKGRPSSLTRKSLLLYATMLKKIFPPFGWLPNYNIPFLKNDAIAGITLAAYCIPVSLAYASLAGLPAQYGIYGTLIGGVFYALLGTSKQLAIGPTSAISNNVS